MKHIQQPLLFPLFLACIFLLPNSIQAQRTDKLRFKVARTYPHIYLTKKHLTNVQSLSDLNKHFPSTWVKSYLSVELTTAFEGFVQTATGSNNLLTSAQKELLSAAKIGTDISVLVRYLPDNNLKHNEVKELEFSFKFEPETDASFVGGQAQLEQYIQEKAIDNVDLSNFDSERLAAVKFTIDEQGKVRNAQIVESSQQAEIDALLLETISRMPEWQAATYTNGTSIQQDFFLVVGNLESCVMNLLPINREL